jgi:BirA family biotin operon repressor/biotin-[acetyl-CoA-carboxylase] ligase
MNAESIKSAIKKNRTLNTIIVFETLDSTNKLLMSGAFHGGTIICALKQTAGRGKHGAGWVSSDGGLWFSYVIKRKVRRPYEYVILSSAAIASVLTKMGLDVQIKWPNDILIKGRKLCGMLVENDSYNGKVVTGIGINVNNKAPEGPGMNAVSLRDILKKKIDLEKFFISIIRSLDRYLSDMKGLKKEYMSIWVRKQRGLKGKTIKLPGKSGIKELKAVKVNRDGTITARDKKGKTHKLKGEVFFL